MSSAETLLLVAAGILFYLFMRRTAENGYGRADGVAANGVGPRTGPPQSTESAIGGFVGAGACAIGGAALGAPQLGVAAAPLCGALGSKVAPYLVAGGKWVGQEIGSGASYLGKGAVAGGKFAYNVAYNVGSGVVHDPLGSTLAIHDQVLSSAVTAEHKVNGVVDRGLTMGYGALPAPVKIAALPIYLSSKVGLKAANVAVDVTKKGADVAVAGGKAVVKVADKAAKAVLSCFGFC